MATETKEAFRVHPAELLDRIKQLVHEGNVRRIIIKNEQGHTLVEVPVTVGVVGVALVPVWAAVGALAALVTACTIEVERRDEER